MTAGGGKPPTTTQRRTVGVCAVAWMTDLAAASSPSSSVNRTLTTGAAHNIMQDIVPMAVKQYARSVSATSIGRTDTLTRGFDFQYGVSCQMGF